MAARERCSKRNIHIYRERQKRESEREQRERRQLRENQRRAPQGWTHR
jgi:hypothetical protein